MKLEYKIIEGMCQDKCNNHKKEIYVGGLYCRKDCQYSGKIIHLGNYVECNAKEKAEIIDT